MLPLPLFPLANVGVQSFTFVTGGALALVRTRDLNDVLATIRRCVPFFNGVHAAVALLAHPAAAARWFQVDRSASARRR
jgi:hypothetical protein